MNMSYCRFRNTANDLRDCAENLKGALSRGEDEARRELIDLCCEILESVGAMVDMPSVSDLEEALAWGECEECGQPTSERVCESCAGSLDEN